MVRPWCRGGNIWWPLFPGGREGMRAEGLEPPRAIKLRGFSYRLRLSPPRRAGRVCGLDYPFTVPGGAGFRCCPSSLYTFPARVRAGLGSGSPCDRVPRIWAVLHRRFPDEHSSFPQVRCVCHSATPAEISSEDGPEVYRVERLGLQRAGQECPATDLQMSSAIT